jgi:hypothetical protein
LFAAVPRNLTCCQRCVDSYTCFESGNLNDLHELIHPKEVTWNKSGLAWLLDVFDWDLVLVKSWEPARLPFVLKLCVGFFPCSMQIKGEPVGMIERQGSGYFSCLSSNGCKMLRLEYINLVCERTVLSKPTFEVQGSNLNLLNSSFSGCKSNENGGVIQSYDKSNVVIDKSNFSDSRSTGFGGAVAAYGGSVHVLDSLFSDVYATRGGGAIWASAYQSCFGLSQYYDTVVEIKASIFANCATKGDGGAILLTSDTSEPGSVNERLDLIIHSSTFAACQSSGYGGALCLSGSSVNAELKSLVMHNNAASSSGGAISASNRVSLVLDRCLVQENTALGCGGAISANNSVLVLVDSVLNNNLALGYGGGVLFVKETLILANGTSCSGNRAPAGGGGVLLTQGSALPSSAAIADMCRHNNSAGYGPCFASECKSLNLTYDSSGSFWAGLPFKISFTKLDAYQQIILTDSTTIAQIMSSESEKSAVEDPSANFSLVGSSISRFSQGMASVEIAVRPIFVEINADKNVAFIKAQPHIFVQSPDMQTGLIMKSNIISIKLEESGNVCPQGYILDLDLQSTGLSLPTSGSCKLCKIGTYSLDPLLGPKNEIPACFVCPTGATCLDGGNIRTALGNWSPVNGILHLIHCPEGIENQSNHTCFAHSLSNLIFKFRNV